MTTLQLARRMAAAARAATDEAAGAVAVLGVLHDTRSWLTRVREDAAGLTVETHYEQAELFPKPGKNGCVNCGEANDGGYETEEVGSFCSRCWLALEEYFSAPPAKRGARGPGSGKTNRGSGDSSAVSGALGTAKGGGLCR